jgi:hypothetical protein
MRRALRTFVIGVLVFMMSVNPAWAWHWFGGGYGGCGSYGGGYHSSYYHGGWHGYYGGSCGYAPLSYYSSHNYGCGGCGASYGGGCDGCGYSGCSGCGGYSDASYGCGGPVIEGSVVAPEMAPEQPANGAATAPAPQWRERPADATPTPELPADPTPEATTPADIEQPTPPAEDDIFDSTETTTPATTPPADMPEEDPAGLFGEPTPPADTPATPPADTPDTSGDIFGETPTETPTTTPDTTTPATPPAETTPTDDFFSEPPAGATEGAITPPADATEALTPPTETPAEGAQPETTDDDPFFGTSILREPGGLASVELRTWVDNTGDYSCRGRLVRFMDGKVRILKDNGRTTTVPLVRLSAVDLEFINRQASAAAEVEAAERVAEAAAGTPLAAN